MGANGRFGALRVAPQWVGIGLCLAVLLWTQPPAQAQSTDPLKVLDSRIKALAKTEQLIEAKRLAKQKLFYKRVREAYKVLRENRIPFWAGNDARANRANRNNFVRRVVLRDLRELGALDEEKKHVQDSVRTLEAARAKTKHKPLVVSQSLVAPVAGSIIGQFGRYRDEKTGLSLARQGIKLRSKANSYVRAVADGIVRYAGPMYQLTNAIVIQHDGYYSILGNLKALQVTAGVSIRAGQTLGWAGDQTYVEIRLDVGPGGLPVDPTPLFVRNR